MPPKSDFSGQNFQFLAGISDDGMELGPTTCLRLRHVVRVRNAPKNLTFGAKICKFWWEIVTNGLAIGTTRVRGKKRIINYLCDCRPPKARKHFLRHTSSRLTATRQAQPMPVRLESNLPSFPPTPPLPERFPSMLANNSFMRVGPLRRRPGSLASRPSSRRQKRRMPTDLRCP